MSLKKTIGIKVCLCGFIQSVCAETETLVIFSSMKRNCPHELCQPFTFDWKTLRVYFRHSFKRPAKDVFLFSVLVEERPDKSYADNVLLDCALYFLALIFGQHFLNSCVANYFLHYANKM